MARRVTNVGAENNESPDHALDRASRLRARLRSVTVDLETRLKLSVLVKN